MFFKEFGGNIMEIVEYVDKEILPKVEYRPIEDYFRDQKMEQLFEFEERTMRLVQGIKTKAYTRRRTNLFEHWKR